MTQPWCLAKDSRRTWIKYEHIKYTECNTWSSKEYSNRETEFSFFRTRRPLQRNRTMSAPLLFLLLSGLYLQFQDHDNIRFLFKGINTLDKFGVMQAVHDADLLPYVFFILSWIGFKKFPCPNFSVFLLNKPEDLSKFSTVKYRTISIKQSQRSEASTPLTIAFFMCLTDFSCA